MSKCKSIHKRIAVKKRNVETLSRFPTIDSLLGNNSRRQYAE